MHLRSKQTQQQLNSMGRKPSKNSNLPRNLRARKRNQKTWYYYDTGGKPRREIPLGSDYALAVKKWAELEMDVEIPRIVTFRVAAERYIKEVIPTKAPSTQKDNLRELTQLYKFFDVTPAPLEDIEPLHIRQYLDYRTQAGAPVRAKREKALFSHIFNKAREWGYTDRPNPCAGVRGHQEKGRRAIYISDEMYTQVYAHAAQPLRDAMDIAYLTGQRPSDVLKITERDIVDGALCITQNKTGAKLRISIEGELQIVLARIAARKAASTVHSLYLITTPAGQSLNLRTLQSQFAAARDKAGISPETFQFRDLRSKAATDKTESSGDIRQAQKQLGHTTISMTEHYVRGRRGEKVKPTK